MQFIFVDKSPGVITALHNQFSDEQEFGFYCGDIFRAYSNVVVSFGNNSYCIMDEGQDLIYRNHFGLSLQDYIQREIFYRNQKPFLQIGEAVSVTLSKILYQGDHLNFIYAPIRKTNELVVHNNISSAFYAVLETAKNKVPHGAVLAIPGISEEIVSPNESAKQMRQAYNLFRRIRRNKNE